MCTEQTGYRDESGFAAFCEGEIGFAHRRAHQMLDRGEFEAGYRFLSEWLEGCDGEGSQWLHLQWHAAVFEIETGRAADAWRRYQRYIAPAVPSGQVQTDAPSLLWRLMMEGIEVDWVQVHAVAVANSSVDGEPYAELHHALAFAGAGDVERLDDWLDRQFEKLLGDQREARPNPSMATATALRLFAAGNYAPAGDLLDETWQQITKVGGSRAQNELFAEIGERAEALAHA